MDFERELRHVIRTEANRPIGSVGDVDSLLDRVRTAAQRRRRNRAVGSTVAVLAFLGAATAISLPHSWSPSEHDQAAATSKTSRAAGANSAPGTTKAEASLSGLQVLSVTATDSQTFWVLGKSGCGGSHCSVVEGTTNGGAGFTPLAAPPTRVGYPITSGTVNGLRFAYGGTDGWAFGGALWATHNGATSWAPVRVGEPGDHVVELEVWRTNAYAVLAHRDESVDLLRTTVGSDNWKPVRTGLSLTDAAGGLAVSDNFVVLLARDRDKTVLASGVAGAWAEQDVPCPDGSPTISANKDSLWLLCAGSDPRAYTSSDAGATWNPVKLTLSWADVIAARGPDQAAVASSYQVEMLEGNSDRVVEVPSFAAYAVYMGFTDDKTGYLVLNDGSLLRTSTSGLQWSPVRLSR
jgi:hypothetical protein